MIYIFVYNVVGIKSDFLKLKSLCPDSKFILIASNYCLRHLNTKNRSCFDAIHQISRNFHHIDYENVKQIVNGYVEEYGSKNINLMTNEDSTQISCAKIRESYGIPGNSVDSILPFVNKIDSKTMLAGVVKTPKFLPFTKSQYAKRKESYLQEIANQLGFPMFAKPVDLVSSIGTHKIDDLADLKNIANEMFTDEYEYEVDEFIDGDLFHCDLILDDGAIKFVMIGECAFHLAKFSKGFPMGSIPVTDKKLYDDLYAFVNRVIAKLNFKKGACHLEVFLEKKSKELVFLEISTRTPGALLPMSYEIQCGINIEEWHYLAHMNLLNGFQKPVTDKFAAWLTFPTVKGEVTSIQKPEIDIQHEFAEYVHTGEVLQQPQSLLDAACSVIFWDKDIKNVRATFEKLKFFQPLKIKHSMDKTPEQTNKPQLNLENHFEIMEELFNALPHVFWKDRQGRYLGGNSNQAKAFNFNSASEFIGKTAFEILEDPELAKIVHENDNEIMNNGKRVLLEEVIPTPYGIKTYLSQKQPLYDDKGVVIGLLGCAMDITQIKEQERLATEQNERLINEKHQLEIDYYKQLAQQQEKFTKLVNQVAHDIRSPLASLVMIVKSCTQIPETDRIALREAAITIGDIANHLLYQYDKKDTADIMESEKHQPILVSAALLESLTTKKYQYESLPIKFDSHFKSHSHFAFIKTESSAFKRMLSNLINNAVDAFDSQPGKIDLQLEADNEWVKVIIQDMGKGMSPELVGKIMHKMAVTEGKESGHGIGLTQVWEALDRNQGEMHIASELGKGTTVTLTFPRVKAPHWIAEEIALSFNDTVIILDDDTSIHSAWRARFEDIFNENTQIQRKHFQLGKEALEFIQSLSPSEKERVFLLSDYELLKQELNGLHVIAQSGINRSILVTSHYADPLVQTQAAKIGTKILPKQLASEIVIKINETDKNRKRDASTGKVDAVIVDDDKAFVNSLLLFAFDNDDIIEEYYNPEHFLKNVAKYPKDTKIFLDNNYATSELKGLDIAKELHERGYTQIYLLSGEAFNDTEIPSYLTIIGKNDIERLRNL